MNTQILHLQPPGSNPMTPESFQARVDQARALAHRRIHSEELAREQAILDGFELDKLHALFQLRALLERYGLERVEVWVANQAKELRAEGKL